MLRKSRKQLTIRFLHRTVLFLTCFSACLAFLFGFGNGQSFLDATQMLILDTLSVSSLFSVLLAMILFCMELFLLIAKKKSMYLPLMGASLACALLCGILSVLARTVILFSKGS